MIEKRWMQIGICVVVLLPIIAMIWQFCTQPPKHGVGVTEFLPLNTWDELKEQHTAHGGKVIREPHLPGPYRVEGRQQSLKGDRASGGWRSKTSEISYRFSSPENGYQVAVGLETEDGKLTVAIFEFTK